jgi:hypothetical protein
VVQRFIAKEVHIRRWIIETAIKIMGGGDKRRSALVEDVVNAGPLRNVAGLATARDGGWDATSVPILPIQVLLSVQLQRITVVMIDRVDIAAAG